MSKPDRTKQPPVAPRVTSRSACGGQHIGADISSEAVEFGRALDKFKRDNRRPYPTVSDVLSVAKSLGYRRDGFDAGGGRVLNPERVAACLAALDGITTENVGPFIACVRRAMGRLETEPEGRVALRIKQDIAAAKKWGGL